MSWVREAASDYTRLTGGYINIGYLGRHMKELVDAEGWEVVQPAWQRYCREQDLMYQSVPHFARTFGQWTDRPRGEGRVPRDRAMQMFRAAGVTPPAIMPDYFSNVEAVERAIAQRKGAA